MNIEINVIMVVLFAILSFAVAVSLASISECNRIMIKSFASKQQKKAMRVQELLNKEIRTVSSLQFVDVLCKVFLLISFIEIINELDLVWFLLSIFVVAFLMTIILIAIPKIIAEKSATETIMNFSGIIQFLSIITFPISFVISFIKGFFNNSMDDFEDDSYINEEIISIVDKSEQEGSLEKDESELVRSALEFNDLDIEDIFTPRIEVIAADKEWDLDKIRSVFKENQYSRLPVYEGTIDKIVGVIHERDFYNVYDGSIETLDKILQKPIYVPENYSMMETLRLLQKNKSHLAIVIDEYGGTEGIVTLEDILEELVGEIWDEHDEIIEDIIKVNDSTFIFTGNVLLAEMFDALDIYDGEAEEFDSNTIGGWITELQERFPERREKLSYKDLTITVLDANDRVVKKIKVVKN